MRRSDLVGHAPALPVREVLRRFWPDARPYRRWLPLGLVLIAAGVAIETAEIYLFKLVVDEVLVPGELGPLLWIGAATAGLLLLGGAVALADDMLGTWLGERFLLTMRTRVFAHLLTLSPDALDRRRLGDVLTRLAGILLVVYFGTRAIAGGGLTLGGMLVFIAYLTRLYGPVRDLSSLSNTVFNALAGAERVIELLDERPRVLDGPIRLTDVRGAIELEDVWFRYDAEPALKGVTLRAAPGERVALVGASGAGKSTIARMLLRWGDPESGAVRIDGHDLRDVELASLRRSVAVGVPER